MDNFVNILERLYTALDIKKDKDFCDKYDIKSNTLSTWKKRDSIPYEKIALIANDNNISFDWLLTGKGKMLIKEEDKSNSNTVGNNNLVVNGANTIKINTQNFNHSKDIKNIIELLDYAPNNFLLKVQEKLEQFKNMSSI